jgi:hypothetical protein
MFNVKKTLLVVGKISWERGGEMARNPNALSTMKALLFVQVS